MQASDVLGIALSKIKTGITPEAISNAVDDWLDDHPEATTTVEDGSITAAKLSQDLIDKTSKITSYSEFVSSIGNGTNTDSNTGSVITVTAPVQLASKTQCRYKSFVGITFNLQSDLFTWSTPGNPFEMPNFINCTFIGNGNSICVDGAYICRGKFVNCNFIDCALVHEGAFVQSTRFINCTIENTVNTIFIDALRVYDTKFIACQFESENKATVVNAYTTASNTMSVAKLAFISCIFEGQTAEIVVMHDGTLMIQDCYTEANTKSFVKTLASNYASNAILRLDIVNTMINHSSGTFFVDIDSSFASSTRTRFVCTRCHVASCKLINSSDFRFIDIDDTSIESGGTKPASRELSKVDPKINSIVDFSTSGHAIVKKFPCLITFDTSDGGWHTNLYLVSLSSGNNPSVVCLSNLSKTPTATYDSETGYVDVTMHNSSGSYSNRSAVLLDGLYNDLNRKNPYTTSTHGY